MNTFRKLAKMYRPQVHRWPREYSTATELLRYGISRCTQCGYLHSTGTSNCTNCGAVCLEQSTK